MKKIALSLMTLGLLQSTAALATAPTPVPAAIAEHNGPIRIAVIRNLGSDDNTTQFVAGALQEGKKLGFKISTFLSNGDDAKFQDFVNQAISQKYDGIILSQGRDPYSTALVKKAVDAGIKVAVFDTAFHSTMPPKAYMYAIPYEYYEKYGVRRYGFHGTSHKYVAHKAAEYLEEPIERLKLITCHLGNGSSIAAVDQGKVVDTSMGMTPLAGLMMGTRCGDLDPSVVNYLKYTLNITGHELDEILNKKSGLLGISGVSSDKRDVEEAALHGNKRAQLASDMLNYQIKKIVGSYIAAMGGVDAIVFTGGIGEHDEIARAKVCHHMDWLGIRIDTDKNEHPVGDVCDITAWGAKVRTLVIATDEELMIARDTKEVVEK